MRQLAEQPLEALARPAVGEREALVEAPKGRVRALVVQGLVRAAVAGRLQQELPDQPPVLGGEPTVLADDAAQRVHVEE